MAGPITFTKMHGAGNDFVLIDGRYQNCHPITPKLIRQLSDRRTGIGFDQLLLIEPSHMVDCYAHFTIFNPDGAAFSQCGNGLRCIGRYLADTDKHCPSSFQVASQGKRRAIQRLEGTTMAVNIGPPAFEPQALPFDAQGQQGPWYHLNLDRETFRFLPVTLDNAHIVIENEAINSMNLSQLGPKLAYHAQFPEGTNVHIYQYLGASEIKSRTYERGAGETLACGTGACAVALASQLRYGANPPFTVYQPGGTLYVDWLDHAQGLWLAGPTTYVFTGQFWPSTEPILATSD